MIHLISDHVETLTLFLLPVSPPDLCGCLPTKESWSWALSTVLLALAALWLRSWERRAQALVCPRLEAGRSCPECLGTRGVTLSSMGHLLAPGLGGQSVTPS